MQNRLARLLSTKTAGESDVPLVDISVLTANSEFPLLIRPKSYGLSLNDWAGKNRELLADQLKRHGALLFRGFKIDTVEKFQSFIGIFDAVPLQYKNRSSPRFEVAKNIYHSTTYPSDQTIQMHSENSYLPEWPLNIVFCCIIPAEEQGETPIADNALVYEYLSEPLKEKFRSKGVRYSRNISKGGGLPWEEVFQTTDPGVVESECTKNGMSFRWLGKDHLLLEWNTRAIHQHPHTGKWLWFNHAFFFNKYALDEETLASFASDDSLPFNTFFGDGTEISKSEIEELRAAYEKSTILFPWMKGDVLFLDNMRISHGRSPYKGERKIIVSMF